jgi:hypothetical protein
MKTTTLLAVLLAATSLAACEKTEVHPPATVVQPTVEKPVAVPTPVPVPVPGPQGEKGDKGDAGKPGDTTVVVPANSDTH